MRDWEGTSAYAQLLVHLVIDRHQESAANKMVPEIHLGGRNCEICLRFKPPVWRRNIWESAKGRSVDARQS
jgi:hypothetical protein